MAEHTQLHSTSRQPCPCLPSIMAAVVAHAHHTHTRCSLKALTCSQPQRTAPSHQRAYCWLVDPIQAIRSMGHCPYSVMVLPGLACSWGLAAAPTPAATPTAPAPGVWGTPCGTGAASLAAAAGTGAAMPAAAALLLPVLLVPGKAGSADPGRPGDADAAAATCCWGPGAPLLPAPAAAAAADVGGPSPARGGSRRFSSAWWVLKICQKNCIPSKQVACNARGGGDRVL